MRQGPSFPSAREDGPSDALPSMRTMACPWTRFQRRLNRIAKRCKVHAFGVDLATVKLDGHQCLTCILKERHRHKWRASRHHRLLCPRWRVWRFSTASFDHLHHVPREASSGLGDHLRLEAPRFFDAWNLLDCLQQPTPLLQCACSSKTYCHVFGHLAASWPSALETSSKVNAMTSGPSPWALQ